MPAGAGTPKMASSFTCVILNPRIAGILCLRLYFCCQLGSLALFHVVSDPVPLPLAFSDGLSSVLTGLLALGFHEGKTEDAKSSYIFGLELAQCHFCHILLGRQ